MPKFSFDNSTYAKFWESREAAQALRIFLNDPDIISQRLYFWQSQFAVDPLLSSRNYDGTATFNASVRKRGVNNMLDMRAPLSESQPRDKGGIATYTGTIPDFAAKGYVETAMEREARKRMFESYFGNDAEILAAYADTVNDMVYEGHQTINNMSAQALSKGSVSYVYGTGIQGNIYKAPVPAANFKTAGTVAWSDASCLLLDQMQKLEEDFRTATGYEGALKWQLPKSMFDNVVLKNAQVLAYVADWRKINDKPSVAGWAVNAAMFQEAFVASDKISPIEVIQESQKDGSVGAVHGWADGKAVLRPTGYAGTLKRANILDEEMSKKYGSSIISEVWSNVDVFSIVNTTLNNGRYKEWHTDLLTACVPALEDFLQHYIVDTTTADS